MGALGILPENEVFNHFLMEMQYKDRTFDTVAFKDFVIKKLKLVPEFMTEKQCQLAYEVFINE